MKEAPGDHQAEDFGLAAAGGHLDDESKPRLIEEIGGQLATRIKPDEIVLVFGVDDIYQKYDRLEGFALRKEEFEWSQDSRFIG